MVSFTGSSSTTPSSDGALQSMADTEPQTIWYGGENADQDACIRLVGDNSDRTLAYLMVHSSRLESCSSYFAAALSQRWTSKRKRSPQELTVQVQGDVRLYTDCFSRMYNPFMLGFKTVEYGLYLLAVATYLAHDDLMSSICLYLASVHPWSEEDEMRIRSSVLSEDFPRGHAQDLLERLDSRLTSDDLRPLITRCMQLASASSERSGREAKELLIHLLTTARVQPQSPTPTFEQGALSFINEEFKLMLIQADNEIGSTYTKAGARDMVRRLEVIRHVLDMLVAAGVADEAVAVFVCYDACLRRLRATALDSISMDVAWFRTNVTWKVAYAYAGTVLTILKKVMQGSLFVCDRDLSVLLMKWLPILEWVYGESNIDVGGMSIDDFCKWYEEVKEVLVPKSLSKSEQGLLLLVFKEENLYDSEEEL